MPDETRHHRNHRSPWTLAEIEFVEKHYGSLSAREIGEKLGRSVNGVNRIVYLSGVGQQAVSPWSEAELTLLRNHYCDGIEAAMQQLPGRTRRAIFRQASYLGLTERSSWNSQEKAFLKKHYGSLPTQKIAASLGRSVSAVRAAVIKLKLGKGQNRRWTEPELALLRAHYENGISGMQRLLPERSKGSIVAQAGKMGLTETRPWQPEEIRILQKYYPEVGKNVVAQLPGRTLAAIKGQVSKLGLHYRKRKPRQVPMLPWQAEELYRLDNNLIVPARQLLPLFPGRTVLAIDAKKRMLKQMRSVSGRNRFAPQRKMPE